MKRFLVWILIALGVALLVACGPALPAAPVNESAAGDVAPPPTRTTGGSAVTAAQAAGATQPAATAVPTVAEPTTAVNDNPATGATGLYKDTYPVGFTADGRPYVGNLDAPVVIEEYSDYQCPYCESFFSNTFDQLLANEIANGQAVLILNDFPLEQIHPQAAAAANAARCAGEFGAAAYWAMHDALFGNFGNWSVSDPNPIFSDYATEIGIGGEQFDSCLAENRYADEVQADLLRGQQAGVRGTPAFVINEQVLSGAQPYATFNTAIARANSGDAIVEEPNLDEIVVDEPEPFTFESPAAGVIGNADAPVVITEFTDYQCPYCARHSQETMPALLADYIQAGIVRYELRDLPLDQLHPQARLGANAARCAGAQDAYWEMHDILFERQAEWSAAGDPTTVLTSYAGEVGIDPVAYSACVSSNQFADEIEANFQEAVQIGIGGTPFFFVDGFPVINGAQPLQVFQQVIDLAANDELVAAIMDARRQQIYEQQQQQAAQPAQPAAPTGPVDVPLGNAYALGDPNAKVTIVEYTDYQCPFCRRHYTETFAQIKRDYIDTGVVYYVFKDFPLTQIHPQAVIAAVAARCARAQGQFEAMHSALFEQQTRWGNRSDVNDVLTAMADEIGLDTATFGQCLTSGEFEDAVMADLNEGIGFGIRGTPGFFINGQPLSGAQPFSVFAEAIEAALSD